MHEYAIQSYLTDRYGPIRRYHTGPGWTWKLWQWRGTPHSLKLQRYWNLTMRLFSVISGTPIGGVLPLCSGAVGVFYSRGDFIHLAEDWQHNFLYRCLRPQFFFTAESIHVAFFIYVPSQRDDTARLYKRMRQTRYILN